MADIRANVVGSKGFVSWNKFHTKCRQQFRQMYDTSCRLFPDIKKRAEFWGRNGIRMKSFVRNNTLIEKFKYTGLCKFDQLYMMACRGTTVYTNIKTGKIHVVFAFNKFFNGIWTADTTRVAWTSQADTVNSSTPLISENERYLGVPDKEIFNGLNICIAAKLDGSCIQAHAYPVDVVKRDTGTALNDIVHIQTLGSINPLIMQKNMAGSVTFDEMFRRLAGKDVLQYIADRPQYSFVFEMCTRQNVIVTKYAAEFICLLSVIRVDDGMPVYVPNIVVDMDAMGIHSHYLVSPGSPINKDHSKSICEQMEKILADTATFGENPEGLVVYTTCGKMNRQGEIVCMPILKLKRSEYFTQHHDIILNIGSVRDLTRVEALVLEEKDDDLVEPIHVAHAKAFREFLRGLSNELDEFRIWAQDMHTNGVNITGQMYAEKVKEYTHCLQRFLFAQRPQVMNNTLGDVSLYDKFVEWFTVPTKTGETHLSVCQRVSTPEQNWFQQRRGGVSCTEPKGEKGSNERNSFSEFTEKQNERTSSERNSFSEFTEKQNERTSSDRNSVVKAIKNAVVDNGEEDSEEDVLPTPKEEMYGGTCMVFCDFDGVMYNGAPKPVDASYKGDWWKDPQSLVNGTFNADICELLCGYVEMGVHVIILTGRIQAMYEQLMNILRDSPLKDCMDRITLICKPEEMEESTSEFKNIVISACSALKLVHIIFIEDTIENLKAITVNMDCRYSPFLYAVREYAVHTEEDTRDVPARLNPFNKLLSGKIVGLIGPQGSGKTSILRGLSKPEMNVGDKYRHVSHDEHHLQQFDRFMKDMPDLGVRECMKRARETHSPSESYAYIMNMIRSIVSRGETALLDRCNNKSDRSLLRLAPVQYYSVVPLREFRNQKGVIQWFVHEGFFAWCFMNIWRRTVDNHNGSTFFHENSASAELDWTKCRGLSRHFSHEYPDSTIKGDSDGGEADKETRDILDAKFKWIWAGLCKKCTGCVNQITGACTEKRSVVHMVDWYVRSDAYIDGELENRELAGHVRTYTGHESDNQLNIIMTRRDKIMEIIRDLADKVANIIPPVADFARQIHDMEGTGLVKEPTYYFYIAVSVPESIYPILYNLIDQDSLKMLRVRYPHVTCVPPRAPTADFNNWLPLVGKKVQVTVEGVLKDASVVAVTVCMSIEGDILPPVEHAHITLAVRQGAAAVRSKELLMEGTVEPVKLVTETPVSFTGTIIML